MGCGHGLRAQNGCPETRYASGCIGNGRTRSRQRAGLRTQLPTRSSIYDGRFANNGWLQELPKPLTKLTWDNPVMIGPAMAARMKLTFKDVVELEFQGKKVKGPIWIQAGHPDNMVTVFLGYGRTRSGQVGTGAGFDVYPMRTSQALWFASGVKLTPTGETYDLASTQGYQTMETPDGSERPLVMERDLEEYKKEPNFAKEGETPKELTLYPRSTTPRKPITGGWRLISTPAWVATIALWLASRKTILRLSASIRRSRAGTCTGFASTPTIRARAKTPRAISSPYRACSARTRRANWFVQ